MPDRVKEKLVEIIQNSVGGCARHWAEVIADGLIANGVTVQEWIPVTERLPEQMRAVIVWTKDKARGEAWLAEDGFEWCESGERADVTHWCKFPQPPKGE